MAITLLSPVVYERDIHPKLQQMAAMADALMGMVAQRNRWCSDVLTDDHLEAGKLVRQDGTPLTAEELALIRAIFSGLDAIRVAANTSPAEGQPSIGQLLRQFV